MKILVILGHPDPGSFNHAIAAAVCKTLRANAHQILFHDLYAEGFDPVLPAAEIPEDGVIPDTIQTHCRQIKTADGIVIAHPNWWGQPPAILKGWIDRVVRPGVAYRFDEGDSGEGVPVGLLNANAALVLNTSNTPENREASAFGDPLEALWKRCIFDLCGVQKFHRRMFGMIVTSTYEQRNTWLDEAKILAAGIFPKDIACNPN